MPENLIVIAIIIGSILYCWMYTSFPDDEENQEEEDKSDEDDVLTQFINEYNKKYNNDKKDK